MEAVPPRVAKYCPVCSTMARMDAARCVRCGHEFSSGLVETPTDALSEPLTEANLHKTRMFTLPTFFPRAPQSDPDASAPLLTATEVADLEKSLHAARRPGRVWAYRAAVGLFFLFAFGLLWWVISHF